MRPVAASACGAELARARSFEDELIGDDRRCAWPRREFPAARRGDQASSQARAAVEGHRRRGVQDVTLGVEQRDERDLAFQALVVDPRALEARLDTAAVS